MTNRRQLPQGDEIFLDHVGFFVADMAEAAALERLGFRLTPFTRQVNRGADGATVPTGTSNRCAMLDQGYLEVLTATSETPLAAQLRTALARYTGLHLIAFAVDDAAAQHARLDAAGFAPQPVVHMRRPAGAAEAAFRIVRVPPEAMPEGRIQCLRHDTPAAVWPPGSTAHANGIEALAGVLLCVADPEEAGARYARFTGRPLTRSGAVRRVVLDRGALHFVAPGDLSSVVPGGVAPALPYMAAVALGSRDLAVTRACFRENGIACIEDREGRLVVAPEAACGATLVVHGSGMVAAFA